MDYNQLIILRRIAEYVSTCSVLTKSGLLHKVEIIWKTTTSMYSSEKVYISFMRLTFSLRHLFLEVMKETQEQPGGKLDEVEHEECMPELNMTD